MEFNTVKKQWSNITAQYDTQLVTLQYSTNTVGILHDSTAFYFTELPYSKAK
jgi:hypothetical protein